MPPAWRRSRSAFFNWRNCVLSCGSGRGRATSDKFPPGSRRWAGRPATSVDLVVRRRSSSAMAASSSASTEPERLPVPRLSLRKAPGEPVKALLLVAAVQDAEKLDGPAFGRACDEVIESTAGVDDQVSLLSARKLPLASGWRWPVPLCDLRHPRIETLDVRRRLSGRRRGFATFCRHDPYSLSSGVGSPPRSPMRGRELRAPVGGGSSRGLELTAGFVFIGTSRFRGVFRRGESGGRLVC